MSTNNSLVPVFLLGVDDKSNRLMINDDDIMEFAKKYEWGFGFASDTAERDQAIEDFAKIAHQVGVPLRMEDGIDTGNNREFRSN